MQAEISYIFHNCFVLKLNRKTFLFDYPSDNYLSENIRNVLQAKIQNSDLYILASHNHQDHFNRNISELAANTRKTTYILSKDIIKKNRSFETMADCFCVAPDQSYRINDLEIYTFRSNDQGVAFLICCNGLNIYFGGDLANWDWGNLTAQEHRLLVDYFAEVLTKLKQRPVQIAFSNTDPRLNNWAGAAQFIDTIKPNLFVPMHTFGETQAISRFLAEHPQPVTGFFQYHQTGDTITLEFPDLEEDV
ncbi:MAG TPA: hypothetical protein DDW65_17790 [Firmicutes bacterium]|jgi:L-ascorbate metabolism protein UlaG (beta-lactamase superfamily)|nr:hypothetical protein [Bacillota bacterium]